jgi:hypothetical protein
MPLSIIAAWGLGIGGFVALYTICVNAPNHHSRATYDREAITVNGAAFPVTGTLL